MKNSSLFRILLSFGVGTVITNALLYFALRDVLKWHGRLQLGFCALGVFAICFAIMAKPRSMFDHPRAGFRFIATRQTITTNYGYHVPIPLAWLCFAWHRAQLRYLGWSHRAQLRYLGWRSMRRRRQR